MLFHVLLHFKPFIIIFNYAKQDLQVKRQAFPPYK